MLFLGGDCSSNQLLSETDLREMTVLYIPNIIEREDDSIEFEHLNITGAGILINWTFVARDIGEGEEYPQLYVAILHSIKIIENINCGDTPYPNVYECSVTPEPVETGDFIGLVLAPLSSAQLLLSFIVLNGAPPGESLFSSRDEIAEGLPLITLGVGKSLLFTLHHLTHIFHSSSTKLHT